VLTTTGLILTASVDDGQEDAEFAEVKSKVKLVQRRLNRNSEPQASIESGSYTYQYARHPPRETLSAESSA
jgi:vesicle transport protein SEC22